MFFEDFFIDLSEFTRTEQLIGTGARSNVYLITEKSTEKKYASKELNPKLYVKENELKQLMRSVANMMRLHHISVLQIKGFNFRSFTNFDLFQPTIITEFIDGRTLKAILGDVKHGTAPIEWNETKQMIVLLGISNAMFYLHKNNVIHLNLLPENVLLDKEFHPHLGGFSQSRNLPELMFADSPNSPMFIGFKVDVFSFGLIAFEILTKSSPSEAKRQITKGALNFPNNVNLNIKSIIRDCLDSDPNKRPTFDVVFQRISSDQKCLESPEILEYIEKLTDASEHIESGVDNLNFNNEIVQTFDTIFKNGMVEKIFKKIF